MKKLLTILLLLTLTISAACSSTPKDENSDFQGNSSTIETVGPDSGDESQSGNGTVVDDDDVNSEDVKDEENKGGNIVKPITGGGDFNAGKDY